MFSICLIPRHRRQQAHSVIIERILERLATDSHTHSRLVNYAGRIQHFFLFTRIPRPPSPRNLLAGRFLPSSDVNSISNIWARVTET